MKLRSEGKGGNVCKMLRTAYLVLTRGMFRGGIWHSPLTGRHLVLR